LERSGYWPPRVAAILHPLGDKFDVEEMDDSGETEREREIEEGPETISDGEAEFETGEEGEGEREEEGRNFFGCPSVALLQDSSIKGPLEPLRQWRDTFVPQQAIRTFYSSRLRKPEPNTRIERSLSRRSSANR